MRKKHSLVLIITFVALLAAMILLTKGKILGVESLQAVAFQMPILGVASMAQLVPMLTGGIDLSVISTANLSGIIAAILLKSIEGSMGIPLAIVCGFCVALAIGAFNGFLVSVLTIPPIIATLGTMILVKGVSLSITKGYIIADFPRGFLFLGNGTLFGIPVPFVIFLGCAIVVGVLLSKTPFGIKVYMTGSNPIATEFSGIDIGKVYFKTYILSAFLSGLMGLLMISRFNAAQAAYGESYLLLTVLACVLGGVDPSGGFGNVIGVSIAVVVLQVIETGFNLLRLSSHLANALWGIILIAVISITRFFEKEI